jgi:hypothetical protein
MIRHVRCFHRREVGVIERDGQRLGGEGVVTLRAARHEHTVVSEIAVDDRAGIAFVGSHVGDIARVYGRAVVLADL